MPSEQGKCKKQMRRRVYQNSCKVCGKAHYRHHAKGRSAVGQVGTFFAKWVPPKDLMDKAKKEG